MTKYTITIAASPLLRDAEEGELISFDIQVLRDDKEIVDTIDQKFGVGLTDAEMYLSLGSRIEDIILDDYKKLIRQKTKDRAKAIESMFADFEKVLP